MANDTLKTTKHSHFKLTLLGFSVGLVFPLIAWGFGLSVDEISPSINAIIVLHKLHPLHYFLDTIPFILATVGYSVASIEIEKRDRLIQLIEASEREIQELAQFAEAIGNEQFDVEYHVSPENNLGQKLLKMRENMLENNKRNAAQNWIGKGRFEAARLLREYNHLDDMAFNTLVYIINYIDVIQGAFYIVGDDEHGEYYEMIASYAYGRRKYLKSRFRLGEGLVGEAAFEKATVHRTELPDEYMTITSGLIHDKKPNSILIVPLVIDEKLHGLVEIGALKPFNDLQIEFVEDLAGVIARTVFNLKTNEQTERLLKQSQKMTAELQVQQKQLEQNAFEMVAKNEEIEKANVLLQEQIQEVKNSQKRQHALLENASEIITIYDKEARVMYESPSIKNILGYDPDELVGRNDFDLAHPLGAQDLRDMFQRLIDEPETPLTVTYSYKTKAGENTWLETEGRNLLHDPAIQGIVFNSRDITARRKAEKEQIMRGKMQALSENSPDIILRFNLTGEIVYVNPTLEQYTQEPKDLFMNQLIGDCPIHEEVKEAWNSIIEQVTVSQAKIKIETAFPMEEGRRILQVNAIPEFDAKLNLDTILVVMSDITERKEQELAIQHANKKITDSINYAKRLQNAIVPDTNYIKSFLPDSFIYYVPKDVVSGDFPWFYEKEDYIYIAAVDCTGHGVPGAMLSLIGFSVLNEILGHNEIYTTGQILDRMHDGVVRTLKQDHPDNLKTADGMDVALVRIHKATNEVLYSGAHRPMYRISNGELEEFKGDKQPIGGTQYKNRKEFASHQFTWQQGDSIFFFSDGFPDQFGGPEKLKYGPKRMKTLFTEMATAQMPTIESKLHEEFTNWTVDDKQMDDLLVIGIRF